MKMEYYNKIVKRNVMFNVVKISNERINSILPQNIKESDVLNETDKKVLGAILHYFLVLDKAKENNYVILPNDDLRKTVGVRKTDVLSSVQNLIELNLIKRECGKSRQKGEKAQASKYYVIWDNITKPVKKPKFEDLFSSFISSETMMGTVDIDTDTDTDIEIDKDKDILDNSTSTYMFNEDINIEEILLDDCTSTYDTIGNSNDNKEKINKKEMKQVNTSKSEMEQTIPSAVNDNNSMEEIEMVRALAMKKINSDKDVMYHSKSQIQYDTALEDLKLQLGKIKDITSSDAYKNYKDKIIKWFNATLPYMKYAKTSKVGKKNTNPNVTITRPKPTKLSKQDQKVFDFWFETISNGVTDDCEITTQEAFERMWVKWEDKYDPSVIEDYKSIVENEQQKQYPRLEEDTLMLGDIVTDCEIIPIFSKLPTETAQVASN